MQKKKMDLSVQAVIFDMDGVITNTMPDHYRAWRTVLRDEGISVSRKDIYLREGQTGSRSVREIFAQRNRPCDSSTADRLLAAKENLFQATFRQRFIPGARIFLKDLFKRKFRLALVTGTSRPEVLKILPPHLYGLFDVVITATDVKNGKPDPEPFYAAIERLAVTPAQAVVIENAPLGIEAAHRAGLKCIAVATSLPKQYLQQTSLVFSSFKELRDTLHFHRNGIGSNTHHDV